MPTRCLWGRWRSACRSCRRPASGLSRSWALVRRSTRRTRCCSQRAGRPRRSTPRPTRGGPTTARPRWGLMACCRRPTAPTRSWQQHSKRSKTMWRARMRPSSARRRALPLISGAAAGATPSTSRPRSPCRHRNGRRLASTITWPPSSAAAALRLGTRGRSATRSSSWRRTCARRPRAHAGRPAHAAAPPCPRLPVARRAAARAPAGAARTGRPRALVDLSRPTRRLGAARAALPAEPPPVERADADAPRRGLRDGRPL